MTKLEEMLRTLGYEEALFKDRNIYYIWINEIWRVAFEICNGTIIDASIGIGTSDIHSDEKIFKSEKLLKQAFNIMQKDLEELRKYESN